MKVYLVKNVTPRNQLYYFQKQAKVCSFKLFRVKLNFISKTSFQQKVRHWLLSLISWLDKDYLSIVCDHGHWETLNVLSGVIYCCIASKELGLPFCIICVSIISPVVSVLDAQKAAFLNRLHLQSAILK